MRDLSGLQCCKEDARNSQETPQLSATWEGGAGQVTVDMARTCTPTEQSLAEPRGCLSGQKVCGQNLHEFLPDLRLLSESGVDLERRLGKESHCSLCQGVFFFELLLRDFDFSQLAHLLRLCYGS